MRLRSVARALSVAVLSAGAVACGDSDEPSHGSGAASGAGGSASSSSTGSGGAGPSRSYALGFTPFPWDLTDAAKDDVYARLETDADLYAFHTTAGVPWVEALAGEPFGSSVQARWSEETTRAVAGHQIYLGLTPLDDGRARLADYWGTGEHMALPPPWDTHPFDHPDVKAAYLAFCEAAIAAYEPDYLAIGLEVNLLQENTPAAWPAYVDLHRTTYIALKQSHPTLPIFVTVTGVDVLPGYTDGDVPAQQAALADLADYSDIFAISMYPFMSAYLANPWPDDMFEELFALAGGRPIALAETGYMAESLTLPSFGLTFEGTPEKQAAYIDAALAAADAHRLDFVVNFVLRDYDALWDELGLGDDNAGVLWRDTGLYDEAGVERPALAIWRSHLARPRE